MGDDIPSIEIGNRIKELLKECKISRADLATKMQISYSTLTKKLNGKVEFNYRELNLIKNELNLNNSICGDIFFSPLFLNKKQKLNWVNEGIK